MKLTLRSTRQTWTDFARRWRPLSEQTQFIVITHNRRTLEGANCIYGITMGDDGVSRVISLQLDGEDITEVAEDTLQPVAAVAL